jgi:hypothetical protein
MQGQDYNPISLYYLSVSCYKHQGSLVYHCMFRHRSQVAFSACSTFEVSDRLLVV